MTPHPMREQSPAGRAVGLAFAILVIIAFGLGAFFFQYSPPSGWYEDHRFPASAMWLYDYAADRLNVDWQRSAGMNFFDRLSWARRAVWAETIGSFDIASGFLLRIKVIATVAGLSALIAGIIFARLSVSRDSLTHLSGRRLWRGYDAVSKARHVLSPDIKSHGRGLAIAPGVFIDRAREVQHVGLFGTTGSGKSTILRTLTEQLLNRGDKVVLHDTKGDITAALPTKSFILLAPQDRRGHAWDVGRDVATTQDGRELAARLIPESRDPMWSAAARDILTGIIVSLQRRKPAEWSWQDLADMAFLPVVDLLALLQEHYPPAALYVEVDPETGAPTRPTHGILITLWSAVVGIVLPLAAAWGNAPPERRLSLTQWLTDDKGRLPRVLVLQRSPRHPKLSQAWIGAAVECLASVAAGPDLSESPTRRIFFLLDEFAQMGKINAFRQLLEVGRSKGIAAVLAMQDVQQLIGLYGDAAAKTMLTLLSLKIVGKLPAGPSATYVANELIGQREVAWQERVRSTHSGSGSNSGSVSYSTQSHRATVPVVTPQYLESRLGAGSKGVTALLLGLGDVFELRWPLNFWPQRRPASQPADWTRA